MTRPATSPGVGVQTVGQMQRKHRRLDRNRKGAAAVLTRMQHGEALHLSYERGMRRCRLSDGSIVADEVITSDHSVLNIGDALFKNMPGQTWRFTED
jgi:hypothetical protein